jgi:two-component system cell cycle response regulator
MKVLVADDDPITRCVLEALLHKWGYQALVTPSGHDAREALCAYQGPRLAILGRLSAAMDSLEICRQLRAAESGQEYAYVVLLGTGHEREQLLEALEAGADDFVGKPFDPGELRVRLRAGERILRLNADLRAAREALQVQATHDPLTSLWNRSAALEAFDRELARGSRECHSVGLAIADIDHFKRVNDAFGHQAGDIVLAEAARRLKSAIRAYDILGRYGGEEFIAVFPSITDAGLVDVAERMRQAVCESPVQVASRAVEVTVSIGAALGSLDASLDPHALIQAADEALYGAKRAGRNQICLAPPARLVLLQSPLTPAHEFAPGSP